MRSHAAVLGCRRSSGADQSRGPQGIGLQDATSERCPSGSSHVGTAAPGSCCSILCSQEHPGLVAWPENFVEGKTQIKPRQLRPGRQQTAQTDTSSHRDAHGCNAQCGPSRQTDGPHSSHCPRGTARAGTAPLKAQMNSEHRGR